MGALGFILFALSWLCSKGQSPGWSVMSMWLTSSGDSGHSGEFPQLSVLWLHVVARESMLAMSPPEELETHSVLGNFLDSAW